MMIIIVVIMIIITIVIIIIMTGMTTGRVDPPRPAMELSWVAAGCCAEHSLVGGGRGRGGRREGG